MRHTCIAALFAVACLSTGADAQAVTPAAKALLKLCLPEMDDEKNSYDWLKLKTALAKKEREVENLKAAQEDVVRDFENKIKERVRFSYLLN